MHHYFCSLFLLFFYAGALSAQVITTGDSLQDAALSTAIWTIGHNTENGLLKAGADYGGEWTRDIAMNSWNAVSLLRPDVAEYSLWSVTNSRQTIGHQYWDKIIWTIAAWNHFLATGNEDFLKEAYLCCQRTMTELEDSCYDAKYGLFTGPAVFQDGIAGYEEPIYDSALEFQSFVLTHPNSHTIKCLSTNAVYYEAYRCLAKMARICAPKATAGHNRKAKALKTKIRRHFYNSEEQTLCYLIDHTGTKHKFQEALGISYAILFDILTTEEASAVLDKLYVSPSGIPAVWPCFKRYSAEQPGRHNVMVWPHVSMYYAAACAHANRSDLFLAEMDKLTHLATQCDPAGEVNFHEIYTIDGVPSGGWQVGALWPPLNHQTWCATGYLRNFLYVVLGIRLEKDGMYFRPQGSPHGDVSISGLRYCNSELNIKVTGQGSRITQCLINGEPRDPFIPIYLCGTYDVFLVLGE